MCSVFRDEEYQLDDAQQITYASLGQRQIRSLIFHLLYAAEGHEYQESLQAIAENLSRGYGIEIPFDSFAFTAAEYIVHHRDELDAKIKPFLHNWRFERVGLCTRLILRYAMWELTFEQTPATIVINEAVELAKCFSEKDAYKFVNGILDEATKKDVPTTV